MFTYEEKQSWKLKPGWRTDFRAESCAFCFFDCSAKHCADVDFYCDNFLPRDID